MRNLAAVLGLGLLLILSGGEAPAPRADYPHLFDTVWSTVDTNFYDPSFHGVDWKAVGARYRAKLPTVHDDRAFKGLVSDMLAELKVSHIHIVPPAVSSARRIGIGAEVKDIAGATVVTEVAPVSDARRQGLLSGDRLESLPDDLYGALGTAAHVRVKGCDGAPRALSIRREQVFWPPEHPGWRWSRLSPRPGLAIGYLRIDRFDDGAAELADQAMAELKDTQALIIDLRGDSGGNISALRLASYFMPAAEAPAIALLSRQYLQLLGRAPTKADVDRAPKVVGAYTDATVFKAVSDHGGAAVFYTEALGGNRYTAPVLVLIGEDTGSAAEGFAWAMRRDAQARFIGRKTSGALLSGEEFPVGGGWTLTLPVHGLWGPEGQDFGDKPVSPDVAVQWTREDLCRARDPDIEAALDLLAAPPR